MISNTLKTAAVAAFIGLGAAVARSAPAAADTITTQCFGGDCYRVRCNDLGYDCVRMTYDTYDRDRYYDTTYSADRSRLVCDADGDNCHYVRVPGYYDAFGVWHDANEW